MQSTQQERETPHSRCATTTYIAAQQYLQHFKKNNGVKNYALHTSASTYALHPHVTTCGMARDHLFIEPRALSTRQVGPIPLTPVLLMLRHDLDNHARNSVHAHTALTQKPAKLARRRAAMRGKAGGLALPRMGGAGMCAGSSGGRFDSDFRQASLLSL